MKNGTNGRLAGLAALLLASACSAGGSSAARSTGHGDTGGDNAADPGIGGAAGDGGAGGTGLMGSGAGGTGFTGASTGGSGGGGGVGGSGGGSASADAGAAPGSGSFGNVGVSGAQDFAAFRNALAAGQIPPSDSIDATGFFAEHYTSLPPPSCGRAFCLHGMLSVSKDLAHGSAPLTLLQMGMNSTIDPATVQKPPLNIAVVLDHSGSMAASGKMDFAKQGVSQLVDALGPTDTFTLIIFDDNVQTLFGPAHVTDKAALKGMVGEIQPGGGTDIYDGLETGYKAVLATPNEDEQRRVIFLTDGLPTVGTTDVGQIRAMSLGYNKQYVGLTTIGLGSDVNIELLRGLAESGGGNFYFIEKPEAVQEVFMQELAFFVAPIAYDLELTFTQLNGYQLKQVYGTSLWQSLPDGGKVDVPSVFLVSRTSTAPDPMTGGRRGGGSAIMAELTNTGAPAPGLETLGKLTLSYRLPGHTDRETQEAPVTYMPPDSGGAPEVPDFYSDKSVEKNTLILQFFFAFRDATNAAQTDVKKAYTLLTGFQSLIQPRLTEWTDEDLQDDLKLLASYIDVLKKAGGGL